jgi:hypothetical protein
MARSSLLLGGLLGLALATGLAAVALRSRLDHGPVYTLVQVQDRLVLQPRAWVGRPIQVRGRATRCFMLVEHGHVRCLPLLLPRLSDPDADAASAPLLMARAAPDSLLVFVRRVPLLGGLLPAPQVVHWGEVATYRVELRAMPDESCGAATCYEALLLDAAPGTLGEG